MILLQYFTRDILTTLLFYFVVNLMIKNIMITLIIATTILNSLWNSNQTIVSHFLFVMFHVTVVILCLQYIAKPLFLVIFNCMRFRLKRNSVRTLLHRAYGVSSSFLSLHKEFLYLKNYFFNNGFPVHFNRTLH